MTPEEVVDVLTTAAAFDQRTIGAGDVGAWHETLKDLDVNECVDAVVAHYRERVDRIMPGHVRQLVRAQRAEREMRALPATVPHPGAYAKVADLLAGRKQAARQEAAGNRAAVLAHPDLAKRLTEPVIGYKRPEQWNGFIPPELFNQSHNDSLRRAALVELLTEALNHSAKENS